MNIELKTHQCLAFCFCVVIVGFSLAAAFTYVGVQVRAGIEYFADRRVDEAKYNELAARHKAIEAIYVSTDWTHVVEAANRRAMKAESRLMAVCSKLKGRC